MRINNIVKGFKKKSEEVKEVSEWNPRSFVVDFVRQLGLKATPKKIVESFLSSHPKAEDSLPASFVIDLFEDKKYIGEVVDDAIDTLGITMDVSSQWWRELPKAYIEPLNGVLNKFWKKSLDKIVVELAVQLDRNKTNNEVTDYILEMSDGDVSIYVDEAKPNKDFGR